MTACARPANRRSRAGLKGGGAEGRSDAMSQFSPLCRSARRNILAPGAWRITRRSAAATRT